jgi:hypothetical protein
MSKLLAAIMAATVFTMVGAALLATSYSMSAPSQWIARVVEGPRSTHFKTSDKMWVPQGTTRGASPVTEDGSSSRKPPRSWWI